MTRRIGVIGDPVQHSLSPHMHNAAFRALGIDATYELWETPLAGLASRIASLRDADVLGANVTVPHKQAVEPMLDGISETATRIGAVNTIVRTPDGLVGENTDAYGFRQSIEAAYPGLELPKAVVLGAGGASRAVIVALVQMGVRDIVLANRTPERAMGLATEFGISMVPWEHVVGESFPSADLLVNATALGWHNEIPVSPAAIDRLPHGTLVMDLTYRDTPLLQAAAEKGRPTLDGLGMLVHQGARAFELWFGQPAPVDTMRDAVLAEQDRRH